MRHVGRPFFSFCSAVSLVLCVAVSVVWVRSYWRGDVIEREWHRETMTTFEAQRVVLYVGQGGLYGRWSRSTVTGTADVVRRVAALERSERGIRPEVTRESRRRMLPDAAWGGFYLSYHQKLWTVTAQ